MLLYQARASRAKQFSLNKTNGTYLPFSAIPFLSSGKRSSFGEKTLLKPRVVASHVIKSGNWPHMSHLNPSL